jgi:hypothetical protein
MTRGFFAVDRGIWDHPVLRDKAPFSRREAWLWLISEACWEPRQRVVGNIIINLTRGQLVASLRFLADKWGWSEPAVRRFLAKLGGRNARQWGADARTDVGNVAMIDAQTDAGITVITIRNYDKYQFGSRSSDASFNASFDAPSDAIPDANTKNPKNKKKERSADAPLAQDQESESRPRSDPPLAHPPAERPGVAEQERPSRPRGHLCPDDFRPTDKHYAAGESFGLTRKDVDEVCMRMHRWSHANANRPVARKTSWHLALFDFIEGSNKRAPVRKRINPMDAII